MFKVAKKCQSVLSCAVTRRSLLMEHRVRGKMGEPGPESMGRARATEKGGREGRRGREGVP
eukprot:1451624-Rhodomonas_salina.1